MCYSTLMLLGAHVSIAGGLDKAIDRGEAIGATCIQTFASSPRTLVFNPHSQEIIDSYLEKKQHSSIQLHVFHGIYLVNLASEKPEYVRTSIESLIHYQETAGAIGAIGTVFHVGSHKGLGFEQVKHQIGLAIAEITHASPDNVRIIIENAAGHSGTVGQTAEELGAIFSEVERAHGEVEKMGLCLDTQHAFASGVDGRDVDALNTYLELIEKEVGLDYLQVIHTNDSKPEFNSHKDRHENIGMGQLGDSGIDHWLHHPALKDLPFILEVPGIEGDGPGKKDIEHLKELA